MKHPKHSPISFPPKLKLPWQYCRYCGLVYLKNPETERAIRLGCDWKELG